MHKVGTPMMSAIYQRGAPITVSSSFTEDRLPSPMQQHKLLTAAIPEGKLQWIYSQWRMTKQLLARLKNKQPIRVALLGLSKWLDSRTTVQT